MALDKNGFGKPDVISNASSLVALSAFSVVGDVIEWINEDNSIKAYAVLIFTPSLVPAAGDTIKLYASRKNVDQVNDEDFPSLTNKKTLLATFETDELAAQQVVVKEIVLDNIKSDQGYLFAIESLLTTALININAGWTLTIIPKA